MHKGELKQNKIRVAHKPRPSLNNKHIQNLGSLVNSHVDKSSTICVARQRWGASNADHFRHMDTFNNPLLIQATRASQVH